MKTLDGYNLKEGEECWVSISCTSNTHRLSLKPRKTVYMDDYCKQRGCDFRILKPLKCDCEDVEVTHIWKNKPE
jgi:hypothetical protein